MIKRADIGYKPMFNDSFAKWTAKEARRRFPGLAVCWEFEDLLQEGACIFAKCCQRYPRVNTPQHMMALYKVAYTRHLINLGAKAYKYRARISSVSVERALEAAQSSVPNEETTLPRTVLQGMLARMSTHNEGPLNCILAKFGGSIEAAASYLRELPPEERNEWLAAARG